MIQGHKSGRVASRIPMFKSVIWVDQGGILGSPFLMADALPHGFWSGLQARWLNVVFLDIIACEVIYWSDDVVLARIMYQVVYWSIWVTPVMTLDTT